MHHLLQHSSPNPKVHKGHFRRYRLIKHGQLFTDWTLLGWVCLLILHSMQKAAATSPSTVTMMFWFLQSPHSVCWPADMQKNPKQVHQVHGQVSGWHQPARGVA